jgi:prepilin-type N-terminal cleavage/methylation domain-containing protein
MRIKINAFTLTELLVALGIIGAIAAMTIPGTLNNINKKMYATKLKNNVEAIKTLADSQMILNRTKDISSTAFSSQSTLMEKLHTVQTCGGYRSGSSENGKHYTPGPISIGSCWESREYRPLSNTDGSVTIKVTNTHSMMAGNLKNGALLAYDIFRYDDEEEETANAPYAIFYVDLNGADKPNVIGRDFFEFYITKDGKIYGVDTSAGDFDLEKETQKCKNGNALSCFSAVVDNGWNMKY